MTWSILVRDENGHFGVAIASRFFSVGSLCVHTRMAIWPGLAIFTLVLAFNLLGDGMRDALDPRHRR